MVLTMFLCDKDEQVKLKIKQRVVGSLSWKVGSFSFNIYHL